LGPVSQLKLNINITFSYIYIYIKWAVDDVVGIVTCYRLDDPGIKSQWGWSLPHPSRPALGHTQALYTMGTGSFLG
jgi:hypothetical protein